MPKLELLAGFENREHLFCWREEEVAKIIHCGEALAEKKRTSLVSTEY